MNTQIANTILMIRPVAFRRNEETAINNYYQEELVGKDQSEIQKLALDEFQTFVKKLREKNIQILELEDRSDYNTPDSIFPNNWVSFHADGRVGLYPMFAENRRKERREDVFELLSENNFHAKKKVDYIHFEREEKYLEGTGSLVLDRVNRKAYCALSSRSDRKLLDVFCKDFGYAPIPFVAYQTVEDERKPIYHTNVVMCVADRYAVICLDCIDALEERKMVQKTLEQDGKDMIAISEDQLNQFAGNMLQVSNAEGNRFLVMSSAAFHSLDDRQRDRLEQYNEIIHSDLKTIEYCGGGSARCMMAEVFLPKKN